MPDSTSFSKVRVQFLNCIALEHGLSPSCSRIATFLFSSYGNSETGECWPSFQTIADRLGVTRVTVKRAINKLEEYGYISTIRGVHTGKATVYKPTQTALKHAKAQYGKGSKIAPLSDARGGQSNSTNRTNLSEKGGQECTPNNTKKQISETGAENSRTKRVSVHFVVLNNTPFEDWDEAFREHLGEGVLAFLEQVQVRSRTGIYLPSIWPPEDMEERLRIVEQISGLQSQQRDKEIAPGTLS